MAEKRMFHKQVIQGGEYLSLSYEAQALYIQLSMTADDDGFIKDSTVACRLSGTGTDEISELIDSGHIHVFPSKVIVIRHWKINNEIKSDRYHATKFSKEKQMTRIDENKVIQIIPEPERNQNGTGKDTEIAQYSIAQYSLDQSSLEQNSTAEEGERREGTKVPDWEDVKKAANDKGISITNIRVVAYLNEQKNKTSYAELIERLNTDEAFIKYLRGLQ